MPTFTSPSGATTATVQRNAYHENYEVVSNGQIVYRTDGYCDACEVAEGLCVENVQVTVL